MKLFFKFFFMGIKNMLFIIMSIVILISPFALGILAGFALKELMNTVYSFLLAILFIIIGYWILFTILHAIDAVKYYKENNTETLEEAWKKTSAW